MAEEKQIALGTLFKINDDPDGVGTYVTSPLVSSGTRPPRERAQIDAVALEDTLDVGELGIENRSTFELTQFWHPGETEHEKLDTLFGTKAELGVQVVTPHATPVTDEFRAKVVSLAPAEDAPGNMISRTVTLMRTGAITRT